MTPARYVHALAAIGLAYLPVVGIDPTVAQDATPLPRNEAPVADVRAALDQARTPAAAIEAYAQAHAADPENPAVADAFIRKMIELNTPQLADEAARGLLARQPEHALALAVRAYVAAMRADTAYALDLIDQAIRNAGDEPFVERTAGQLVAWYFVQEPTSDQTVTERRNLQQIRRRLGGRREYAEAFREARDVYSTLERPLFPRGDAAPDALPPGGHDAARGANPPAPVPGDLPDPGYWPYDDGYVPDGYYWGGHDDRWRWGYPYGFLPVDSYGGVFWGGAATGVPAGYAVVPGIPRLYYPVPQPVRPGDNGPMPPPARPRVGPLFTGPGDKDADRQFVPRDPPPTWGGGSTVRPPPPIWGSGPQRPAPPIFKGPGDKPTNRPPPGTKPN